MTGYPPQGQQAGAGASLDGNDFLPADNMYPCFEDYSNHNGNVDNYMEVGTSGNATTTENTTDHSMDLVTGVTVVGVARYNSKRAIALSTKPWVVNGKITNMVSGVGGTRDSYMGLSDDWTDSVQENTATFRQDLNNAWTCVTAKAASYTNSSITAITPSDIMTIVATSSKVRFFVNGTLVATHTTDIPIASLKLGANVLTRGTAATTSREMGVDFIGNRRYL